MPHKITGDRIDPNNPPDTVIDPADRWLAELRFVLPDGITVGELGAVLHQAAYEMMHMPHGNSNAVLDPTVGFAFASVLNKNDRPAEREDVIVFPLTLELHNPLTHQPHWFALSGVEQTVLDQWEHERDGIPVIHDTDIEGLLSNDEER